MREILEELTLRLADDMPAAMATILAVSGSAYRREGAKMICRADGELVGSVSGGCVDGEVFEQAREAIERGELARVRYETGDESGIRGLGVGCNGVVDMLIEPLDWWRSETGRAAFARLRALAEAGRPAALVTHLGESGSPARAVARVLVERGGARLGSLGSPALDAAAEAAAAAALAGDGRAARTIVAAEPAGELFVDRIEPPARLVVVGSGRDAVPLVRIARELGFFVTVADSRGGPEMRARFADADAVVETEAKDFLERVPLDGRPAVVLMTHNFVRDSGFLLRILRSGSPLSYLGVLGPRHRSERILADLAAEPDVPEGAAATVRTPVGLDIGAGTPAEIALSILAEVLAARTGRDARPLSARGAGKAAA